MVRQRPAASEAAVTPSAGTPDDILDSAPVGTGMSRIVPVDEPTEDEDEDQDISLAAGDGPEEDPAPVALPFVPAKSEDFAADTPRPKALRIKRDFTLYFYGDPVYFRVGDDDITDPGIMQRAVAERKPVEAVFETE